MEILKNEIINEEDIKTSNYDFVLPEELIAQIPVSPRDRSRLLVYNKKTNEIKHTNFYNIINFLNKGDLLVLNNTRVIPAKIYGIKDKTGARVEFLLTKPINNNSWLTLAKRSKRVKINDTFTFGEKIKARVIKVGNLGERTLQFYYDNNLNFLDLLKEFGEVPLPPYINQKLDNPDQYQTIYAQVNGSVAAPTAGFHFTKELIEQLKNKGIKFAYITLHINIGTFRPVKTEIITEHKMHKEFFSISKQTAEILNIQKNSFKKIIAVGTTVLRALETVFNKFNKFVEYEGETDIFIYPGKSINSISGMITNFHLPRSTLIMLVSAFVGREKILSIYKEAIEKKYRFFSFGDSMFIL